VFHVFGRKNLEYLGSFSGLETANTDGICVTSQMFPRFPKGAVFAVHDDCAVVGFSFEDIVRKFGFNVANVTAVKISQF
jgi:3-phytase